MITEFIKRIGLKTRNWCLFDMKSRIGFCFLMVFLVFSGNSFATSGSAGLSMQPLKVGVFTFVDGNKLNPGLFKHMVQNLRYEAQNYYGKSIEFSKINVSERNFIDKREQSDFEYLKSYFQQQNVDIVLFLEEKKREKTYAFYVYDREGVSDIFYLPINKSFDRSFPNLSTGIFLSLISSISPEINKNRVF